MDPSILSFQPAGKRPPHSVDVRQFTGAEEVLFHKADAVLDRAFALWIMLTTNIQLQILFLT